MKNLILIIFFLIYSVPGYSDDVFGVSASGSKVDRPKNHVESSDAAETRYEVRSAGSTTFEGRESKESSDFESVIDSILPVEVSHLHIIVYYPKSKRNAHKMSKTEMEAAWAKACLSLGESFTSGMGPYGLGIANSYDCSTWGDPVAPKSHSWVLKVSVGLKKTTIALFTSRNTAKKRVNAISSVKIVTRNVALPMIENTEFSDLLSLAILDQMPMYLKIDSTNFVAETRLISGVMDNQDREYLLPPPVKNLVLYRLEYNDATQVWMPEVVARAKLTQSTFGDENLHARERKAEMITWKLDRNIELSDDDYIYAHNDRGRNKLLKTVKASIADVGGKLLEREQSSILKGVSTVGNWLGGNKRSAYLDLRYSSGILNEGDLGGGGLLSVSYDFRSGGLNGLEVNLENWSESEAVVDGTSLTSSASKVCIGRGFYFEGDIGLLTALDVGVRAGVWSLHHQQLKDDEFSTANEGEFAVDSMPFLGVEIGADAAFPSFKIRAWLATDFTILSSEEQSKVNDSRFGADLHYRIAEIGAATTSILVSTLWEQTLVSGAVGNTSDNVNDTLNEVSLDQGYFGGGIAVSW